VQTRYLLLIPHPDSDLLLVARSSVGTALPAVTRDDGSFWQNVDHINAMAESVVGTSTTVRRCLAVQRDDEEERRTTCYLLEVLATPPLPLTSMAWLAVDAARLQLPDAERALFDAWRSWQVSCDTRRVPWYETGWHGAARAWLAGRLGPLDAIKQLRSWQRSAVVRIDAGGERFFLKAVPPHFAHELPLSVWLAHQFPECVPAVQAADPERGWLLLRAAPGVGLDTHPDAEQWAMALRAYAELQIATVPHAQELAAFGVPVRDDAWLRAGLDALLSDEAAFLLDRQGGLNRDELTALRARGPALHDVCAALATCGIPPTLEHGDFGPWQVLADGPTVTFLDWSDSAIACPLWSLASFLIDLPLELSRPHTRARLVDAYLAPWERLVPRDTLRRAWALADELYGLVGALIYHREILPHMEVRWEMERMLPFFARRLLATRDTVEG
jgi:hypothetical protein